jgi:acyl-[acyl-carrier-protein]-phospholipid O-acyltransferase/long-chain-fatty-acid--[acyl-carrier-protein] ligase
MSDGTYRELLKRSGLQPFLWTQFLGAFNDNCYRFVIGLLALEMGTAAGGHYIALGLAIYNLPFLLFSGYAGYLADTFSKRTVLIVAKSFEILAMGMSVAAILSNRMDWMLAILFLMATHSAFFGPAKLGIIPEMLPDKDLSRANGLLEMSTFLAIILGPAGAALLLGNWRDRIGMVGAALVAVAVIGTATSFGIPRVAPSGAKQKFRLNPWSEVGIGLRRLRADRPLFLTAIGITFLWFLGALCQGILPLMADEFLKTNEAQKAIMLACLAAGIGVGSMAAGRLSGDKVELGLVPLGSLGMGVFALATAAVCSSYALTLLTLGGLGCSGGLFIVPLYAFLQQRSGRMEKGRLIAANNFLNAIGIFAAAGVMWVFHDLLRVSAAGIILFVGIFTILATVYAAIVVSDFLVRFLLYALTHTIYRIRVSGQRHVPFRGPALLVANHVTYIDGFLIGSCVQRLIRFMVGEYWYEKFRWFFGMIQAIPVPEGTRKSVVISLRRARQELINGHVACIFAEGALTRTGNLLGFHRGLEKIVEGLDVPVVPVYLGGVWGSIFSHRQGRLAFRLPRRIPYPVSVTFGPPLTAPVTSQRVRQAVMELGADAAGERISARDLLHLRFIRGAKKHGSRLAMADTTGRELTYRKALVAAMLLARRLRTPETSDRMLGIMLPASVAGALVNIAALMAGRVPVNLNFTAGKEAVASAIEQCRVRTVVTSRIFLSKIRLEPPEGTVFLEDLLKTCTGAEKLRAAAKAVLLPARILERWYNPARLDSDSLATVMFSSGSTGRPKGVMLSHRNVIANVDSMEQLFRLTKHDKIAGVLPFFHSFGFTVTLWFPLVTGLGVAFHPDPLDAKAVGALVAKHKATMLLGAPSFCKAYARVCTREQFATLRLVIVGAERLQEGVARSFEEAFGVPLLEGYGCTEMSPVVAVNILDVENGSQRQAGRKPGTVGHPMPGVAAKVVDLNTGEPLPYNQEGLLLVKGPNRMLGYLGQPEKTQEVIQDGWYVTRDMACIDEDGFIRITDRLSKFSKIGGEMVPHLRIEEALQPFLEDRSCVVVAIPDEQKGERLVIFHTKKDLSPDEVRERLSRAELPKLWIPKRDSIHFIEALPTIGTGKLDLRRLKTLAMQLASAATPAISDEAR